MSEELNKLKPQNLLYTERGIEWLSQFEDDHKDAAAKLASSLTLISHQEFNRSIHSILESESEKLDSPVALFAIREVDQSAGYFAKYTDKKGVVAALTVGSDHGSEARIAALIRNVCKGAPNTRLNHPAIAVMRDKECKTIALVDDFIGSGNRVCKFLDSFMRDRTISSWLSLKYLKIVIIAYSGTTRGIKKVLKHKTSSDIIIVRDCPDVSQLPWKPALKEEVRSVCKRYARRTNKAKFWDGYGHSMATIVFEHGCPNNLPAIFWAARARRKVWKPLFPSRVILSKESSIFPPEVLQPDAGQSLKDIGQEKLANSGALMRRGEMGKNILIVLALIAQGQRKRSTISFATGLNVVLCSRIIENCIAWEFITDSFRLTKQGKAELASAKKIVSTKKVLPDEGDNCYYPSQLREIALG